MKILKMILLGFLGIIICIIGFALMVTYTKIVFGLVVSLLGSLAGAHAVLGYLGKDKINAKNFKKVLWISVIFALLGSIAPYLIFASDAGSLLFIFLGVLGGYEFVIFLYRQHLNIVKKPVVIDDSEGLFFSERLKLYVIKLIVTLRWYFVFALIFILIGKFLIPGVGVSWVIIAILAAYNIWQKKVFTITAYDKEFMLERRDGTK